jgi:dihydroorotate dehydrogenase
LATLSTSVVRKLYQNLQGEIPIIGVGGIDSAASAVEKFAAGADLIQLYTGFIYHGPNLIRDIVKSLCSYSDLQSPVPFPDVLRKKVSNH